MGKTKIISSVVKNQTGIDKRDYIKIKSFFTTKEIVTSVKRLPSECGKFFAS
jgi:hypothetical protein